MVWCRTTVPLPPQGGRRSYSDVPSEGPDWLCPLETNLILACFASIGSPLPSQPSPLSQLGRVGATRAPSCLCLDSVFLF